MKNASVIKIVKQLFDHMDLSAFANSIPQLLLAISYDGTIIFANHEAQKFYFKEPCSLTPFSLYKKLIPSDRKDLLEIIDLALTHKQSVTRQIITNKKTYLVESKTAFNDKEFVGVTVLLTDVTSNILKEK